LPSVYFYSLGANTSFLRHVQTIQFRHGEWFHSIFYTVSSLFRHFYEVIFTAQSLLISDKFIPVRILMLAIAVSLLRQCIGPGLAAFCRALLPTLSFVARRSCVPT